MRYCFFIRTPLRHAWRRRIKKATLSAVAASAAAAAAAPAVRIARTYKPEVERNVTEQLVRDIRHTMNRGQSGVSTFDHLRANTRGMRSTFRAAKTTRVPSVFSSIGGGR